MRARLRTKENGQTMMIVGVLLGAGVLIGLVAIAFDGGSALLQRRTMQNAAEAGAMAGMNLLAEEVFGSCNPAPCRPVYIELTNNEVWDRVEQFAGANRGGTVGQATYSVTLEYHIMPEAPSCSGNAGGCYQAAPDDTNPVPDFVDGVRVTSVVDNPTTFAKAIPNPLSEIQVGAKAAARMYPTCRPESREGPTLPFTRFRPALEREITNKGNNRCDPYEFWESNADIGGPANNNFKNLVSFNEKTFRQTEFPNGNQLLTSFDLRDFASGFLLGKHDRNNNPPEDLCPTECADMGGTLDTGSQELEDWIYHEWQGVISTTHVWPVNTMTRYPAIAASNWGRDTSYPGLLERGGDWAEGGGEYTGNNGENIQGALHDLARIRGNTTDLTVSLNWGKAITRTIYVWGDSEADLIQYPGRSAQRLTTTPGCSPTPCTPTPEPVWEDVNITVSNNPNNPFRADEPIQRVRFTKTYDFVFYANLQGGEFQAQNPPGCNLDLTGSAARGFIATEVVGDPSGSCGWIPGEGVYVRQVDP